MADFALIDKAERKGPQNFYEGQDDNSAGYIAPYKLASGIMRGIQGVGGTGVNIDSKNQRITLGGIVLDGKTATITTTADDGSKVGLGAIPGSTTGERGNFMLDSSGNLSIKIVDGTITSYDTPTGKRSALFGKLPDGKGGVAGANEGFDVVDDGGW